MRLQPSEFKFLSIEVEGSVAVASFNRPDKLNACAEADHEELARFLRGLQLDPDLNAAVVTGKGRAFSVGGDIDLIERMNTGPEGNLTQLLDEASDMIHAHIQLTKPVVAAVNGVAMGAGAAFGLMCDFIIMEEHARIADGHIRAALAAGDGGVIAWPLSVGLTRAKKYLLTGDWIEAEDALAAGLVTEVVPTGRSLERALEIARRLADGPQLAIRTTKKALNQWMHVGVTAFEQSVMAEGLTMRSEETLRAVHRLRSEGQGAIAPEEHP